MKWLIQITTVVRSTYRHKCRYEWVLSLGQTQGLNTVKTRRKKIPSYKTAATAIQYPYYLSWSDKIELVWLSKNDRISVLPLPK
jgi:hypothetical protein